ncbi:MAG: NUDIX hydrolase, partial [Chloroflexota bacterium]
ARTSPSTWSKSKTELGPKLPLFQVRYDHRQNPRNQAKRKVIVIESPDWINVVAVTPDKKIVVVRQFRFGTEKISTEIPGGLVDPGEDPKTAAMRELREETGYTSTKWHYMGTVEANPAFLPNVCHQWYAEDAIQTEELDLDEGEDIIVDTLTLDELGAEIRAGTFRHSLALLALAHVFDLRELRIR